MKALVWTDKNEISFKDVARPQIQDANDVLIKVKYTGICGTDLHVVKGNETIADNIIMGHEAIGEVVEVGAMVSEYQPGDVVVIDPNQYCCDCEYCKRGLTNFCTGYNGGLKIAGINVDGTFAEYFVCHKRYVYRIPEGISPEAAVLIEPLACVLNNVRAAKIQENESVLVLGCGPMGVLCEMVARKRAALVVGTENSAYRSEFAKQWCDAVISPKDLNEALVRKLNGGKLFDVIIDTVGNQFETAVELVEKHGRIIPMGMNQFYTGAIRPYTFINKGISLIGASEYNMLFTDTIEALRGYPELGKLVTNTYALEDYREAFGSILGYDMETKEGKEIQGMKVVFQQ